MNLEAYRVSLGWSKARLAKEAEVSEGTVRDAEKGKSIYKATAGKLARAISKGLGKTITYEDIEGLSFAD